MYSKKVKNAFFVHKEKSVRRLVLCRRNKDNWHLFHKLFRYKSTRWIIVNHIMKCKTKVIRIILEDGVL